MAKLSNSKEAGFFSQTNTMVVRNIDMLSHQKTKIATLVIIPLICAVVVTFIASDNMFEYYDGTLSGFLTLICACIFTGVFNSISEIYPEREIIRREYAACMNLNAYVMAKMIVQFLICFIQSFILLGVLSVFVTLPEQGIVFENSFIEYFVTIYLLMLASDAMGLLISSFVKNASSASIIAPVVLICQMAFSGALFKLEGITKSISSIMVSRWAMEAIGATSNLNDLPIDVSGMPDKILDLYPNLGYDSHEFNDAYDPTVSHIVLVWIILTVFAVGCSVISALMLKRIVKDSR